MKYKIIKKCQICEKKLFDFLNLDNNTLKNRQKIANDRISQAESEAIESIKHINIEIAIKATEALLQQRVDSKENIKVIDEAIEELPNKLVG